MKYQVLNDDRDVMGNYPSVTKAVRAIEEYFQCGIREELPEVKKSLRLVGFTQVTHNVFEDATCQIEKI